MYPEIFKRSDWHTFDKEQFEERFPRRDSPPCANAVIPRRFPRQNFNWRIRICVTDNTPCTNFDRPDAVKLCPVLNGYTPYEYRLPTSDMASRTPFGWITSDQYVLCPVSPRKKRKDLEYRLSP